MRQRHLKITRSGRQHTKTKAETKAQTAMWAAPLAEWYRVHHRQLPWRARHGRGQDPYKTWLSEIMLQQTTVATVKDYYRKFLARWPTLADLARASEEEVLREWAGLGYYSRARNLHKCARALIADHKGVFPDNVHDLQELPGVGPYTAAAVAAMAFGVRTVPVDGNVERVMARIYALDQPPAQIKAVIKTHAQSGLDQTSGVFAGDFAQGLMDLGATICTPKNPRCEACPVAAFCQARARGQVNRYPVIAPKAVKPRRYGIVYVIENEKGALWIEKRPDRGLLAKMPGLPTTDWITGDGQPGALDWDGKGPRLRHIGQIRHSFTHFDLDLKVMHGRVPSAPFKSGRWIAPDKVVNIGLPQLFVKVLARVRGET